MKLAQLLDDRGWKPADLASRMPGVSRQLVARWAQKGEGARVPNGVYMCWLMEIFGVRPAELVGTVIPEGTGTTLAGSVANEQAVNDLRQQLAYLEGMIGDLRADIDHRVAAVEWEQAQTTRAVES